MHSTPSIALRKSMCDLPQLCNIKPLGLALASFKSLIFALVRFVAGSVCVLHEQVSSNSSVGNVSAMCGLAFSCVLAPAQLPLNSVGKQLGCNGLILHKISCINCKQPGSQIILQAYYTLPCPYHTILFVTQFEIITH